MKALIAGCMLLLLGTPSWAQDAVPNPAPPHPELRPVLDDFGGMPGLTALMDSFMEIMLEDPRLRPFFEHTENDRIKRQLAEQFCVILGGDCVYTGRDMVESHNGSIIDRADFNALVEDLQIAMDRHEIPFRSQNKLLAILAPMHREVITPKAD
ncbi:MAG: group 1 truncated hemoglobin [Xanthomonadales bacterium]|nr:group 1 truncated hemoglobin [Xanthomonadales bacterium]